MVLMDKDGVKSLAWIWDFFWIFGSAAEAYTRKAFIWHFALKQKNPNKQKTENYFFCVPNPRTRCITHTQNWKGLSGIRGTIWLGLLGVVVLVCFFNVHAA